MLRRGRRSCRRTRLELLVGVPVAFIGLTLEATPTMVVPSGVAGVKFEKEAATVNSTVHELQKQGIHSFVVLIHQGGAQVAEGAAGH